MLQYINAPPHRRDCLHRYVRVDVWLAGWAGRCEPTQVKPFWYRNERSFPFRTLTSARDSFYTAGPPPETEDSVVIADRHSCLRWALTMSHGEMLPRQRIMEIGRTEQVPGERKGQLPFESATSP